METINGSISGRFFIILIALLFLSWRPALIQSETLTLSTYYPAPYAGYNKLLTTGNTYLAKNPGSFVQWGTSSKLTTDQGGSIELVGSTSSDRPYISFQASGANIRLSVSRICSTGKSSCTESAMQNVMSINSDLYVTGSLRRICAYYPYKYGGTSYCGGSLAASKGYTLLSTDTMSSDSFPSSGKMLCCKFEAI